MTLEEKLASAEAAYHNLLTGTAVVEVRDQNGEMVRYNAASAPRLAAYINELKRQLSTTTTTGPLSVWF